LRPRPIDPGGVTGRRQESSGGCVDLRREADIGELAWASDLPDLPGHRLRDPADDVGLLRGPRIATLGDQRSAVHLAVQDFDASQNDPQTGGDIALQPGVPRMEVSRGVTFQTDPAEHRLLA